MKTPYFLLVAAGLLTACGSSSSTPNDGPTDVPVCGPTELPGCPYGDILDEHGCSKGCKPPPDAGTDLTSDGPTEAPGDGPADFVCGPGDGAACIYGYILDEHGCSKGCKPPTCPALSCALHCDNGLQKDLAGCEVCACQPAYSVSCGSECFDALYAACTPTGACKFDTASTDTCFANGVRVKRTSNEVTLTTTDGTTTCFTQKEEGIQAGTTGAVVGTRVIYRNAAGNEVARREDTGRGPIFTCGTTQVALDPTLCPGLAQQRTDGLPPLRTRTSCTPSSCP